MNEDSWHTPEQDVSRKDVSLVIERFAGTPGEGRVALLNERPEPVHVWRNGSQWGDVLLSFRAQRSGTIIHVVRRPQLYTVNVRSAVMVPASAHYYWSFDFGDGTWEPDVPFQEWVGPGATLVAVYRVDPEPDALEYAVLIGTLASEPATWRER